MLFKIASLLNLAGLAFVLGVFVFTEFVYKRPLPDNQKEFQKLVTEESQSPYPIVVKFDQIFTNLPSTSKKLSFVQFEIHFVLYQKEAQALLEKMKPVLKDLMIVAVGRMEASELATMSGKFLLEEKIRKATNNLFPNPLIKRVLFTTFIVQ
jgi:flagellar FliL protein